MDTKLEEDFEEVRYLRKRRKNVLPSFEMLCNGNDNRNYKGKSMDAISYLENMSPKSKEMKTWRYLKENRDADSNMVIISLTTEEKRDFFYKGIKKLVKDDVARKVNSGAYMINPFFFVPRVMDEDTVQQWDSLKEK